MQLSYNADDQGNPARQRKREYIILKLFRRVASCDKAIQARPYEGFDFFMWNILDGAYAICADSLEDIEYKSISEKQLQNAKNNAVSSDPDDFSRDARSDRTRIILRVEGNDVSKAKKFMGIERNARASSLPPILAVTALDVSLSANINGGSESDDIAENAKNTAGIKVRIIEKLNEWVKNRDIDASSFDYICADTLSAKECAIVFRTASITTLLKALKDLCDSLKENAADSGDSKACVNRMFTIYGFDLGDTGSWDRWAEEDGTNIFIRLITRPDSDIANIAAPIIEAVGSKEKVSVFCLAGEYNYGILVRPPVEKYPDLARAIYNLPQNNFDVLATNSQVMAEERLKESAVKNEGGEIDRPLPEEFTNNMRLCDFLGKGKCKWPVSIRAPLKRLALRCAQVYARRNYCSEAYAMFSPMIKAFWKIINETLVPLDRPGQTPPWEASARESVLFGIDTFNTVIDNLLLDENLDYKNPRGEVQYSAYVSELVLAYCKLVNCAIGSISEKNHAIYACVTVRGGTRIKINHFFSEHPEAQFAEISIPIDALFHVRYCASILMHEIGHIFINADWFEEFLVRAAWHDGIEYYMLHMLGTLKTYEGEKDYALLRERAEIYDKSADPYNRIIKTVRESLPLSDDSVINKRFVVREAVLRELQRLHEYAYRCEMQADVYLSIKEHLSSYQIGINEAMADMVMLAITAPSLKRYIERGETAEKWINEIYDGYLKIYVESLYQDGFAKNVDISAIMNDRNNTYGRIRVLAVAYALTVAVLRARLDTGKEAIRIKADKLHALLPTVVREKYVLEADIHYSAVLLANNLYSHYKKTQDVVVRDSFLSKISDFIKNTLNNDGYDLIEFLSGIRAEEIWRKGV